ncbi:esterase FE4-like [Rhynchophorus ferrugineus]|uniref:esterase FE4-like n=1 Tax=Rhynchophorus ferrugineus TaxID=354439 RepID=UPI003FCD141E
MLIITINTRLPPITNDQQKSLQDKEFDVATSTSSQELEPIVEISTGKIQGRALTTVDNKKVYYGFLGIPYGQPPIGNLRFHEPLPAESWNDILSTKTDGKRCIQFISTSGSEDCLNINVFTPKLPNATSENTTDTLLPVMVWIYGGAFANGASTIENFSPDYLIDDKVLVVTFNYRVGVFGFLSTGDYAAPGNWGLKDQILALKWIKDNIVQFGGDPESVTLFGESAGAACVSILVQSTLAKGLFHRAIMQSGTSLNQWSRARSPRESAFALGRILDIRTNDSKVLVDQLRKIDNRTLQTTSTSTNLGETILHNPLDGLTFAPTIEVPHPGAVFTNHSHETLRNGDINRIPVIVGFNSQEALPFIDVIKYLKPYIATYDIFATRLVPDSLNIKRKLMKVLAASIIRKKYFGVAPITFSTTRLTQFVTDDQFARPIYEYVRQSSKYSPTYFYIFSYEGPLGVNGKKRSQPGVGHTEDNKYLWNIDTNIKNPPSEDVLTRKRLVRLWTNFAKSANPTPTPDAILQNITWAPSNIRAMIYLNISRNLELNVEASQYIISFWDRIFQIYGQSPYDTY